MTDIKFRAWDKTRKKMFKSPKWVEFSVNIKGELSAKNYDYEGNEQALEILQYTGLKDKNGVEIYEGDVVKYVQELADYHHVEITVQVEFDFQGVNFNYTADRIEIIGNLYEN